MSGRRGESWKVVLVVEDDSDGRALSKLAAASGLACHLDWLPAYGIGNIKRRGKALIRLAQDRIESGSGCVAVVVDRDGRDANTEEPHQSIRKICRDSKVPYLEAIEAFESWCLADDGIVCWLGVTPSADTDRIRNPRKMVADAYYRKAKRDYHPRHARVTLMAHATGVTSRSASWTAAIRHLAQCPSPPSRPKPQPQRAINRRAVARRR